MEGIRVSGTDFLLPIKTFSQHFFLFYFLLYRRRARQEKGEKTIGKRTLVILSIFIGNISYVPYCPVLGVLQYNFFSFLNKTKYVYCKPIWVFSLCGSSELTFQEFVRNILVFFFWKSSGFFFLRSIMAGWKGINGLRYFAICSRKTSRIFFYCPTGCNVWSDVNSTDEFCVNLPTCVIWKCVIIFATRSERQSR